MNCQHCNRPFTRSGFNNYCCAACSLEHLSDSYVSRGKIDLLQYLADRDDEGNGWVRMDGVGIAKLSDKSRIVMVVRSHTERVNHFLIVKYQITNAGRRLLERLQDGAINNRRHAV